MEVLSTKDRIILQLLREKEERGKAERHVSSVWAGVADSNALAPTLPAPPTPCRASSAGTWSERIPSPAWRALWQS